MRRKSPTGRLQSLKPIPGDLPKGPKEGHSELRSSAEDLPTPAGAYQSVSPNSIIISLTLLLASTAHTRPHSLYASARPPPSSQQSCSRRLTPCPPCQRQLPCATQVGDAASGSSGGLAAAAARPIACYTRASDQPAQLVRAPSDHPSAALYLQAAAAASWRHRSPPPPASSRLVLLPWKHLLQLGSLCSTMPCSAIR